MNLCWEAMVAEMRAERAEADHRRHFTEDKKPIQLVRAQLNGWTEIRPERDLAAVSAGTARSLAAAADDLEVG